MVTESHPFTRAVSVGIFVNVGTRDEPLPKAGVSHFLEHLVFKGTRKRSGYELARVLDAVGGELNAFTSKEYTCFHATSLKEHLELALDVVLDLVTGPKLGAGDFKKEREVILQEIQMSKDSLEEYILDEYLEKIFAGHPLATPILGTEETLANLSRSDVVHHYESFYRGPRLIVSVAGPVEHDQVVEYVERVLGRLPKRDKLTQRRAPRQRRVEEFIHRPAEQVHLLVGLPSCSFNSKLRFEAYVVNDILGGGVTSRFYQKVREDKALAYGVNSFLQAFVDSGLFLTYASTGPENALAVLQEISRELSRFVKTGVRAGELKMFKTQVKGQLLLGAEDMDNRMNSLGVNELIFGRYRPVDEVIEDIEGVSLNSVGEYVDKYFDLEKLSLMVMGDLQPDAALHLMNNWK